MNVFAPRVNLLFAPLVALGACSGLDDTEIVEDSIKPPSEFSAEHKRAALALSIGSDELTDPQDEEYKLVLCSVALEAIQEKIKESGLLTPEQQQAFDQARKSYEQRAVQGANPAEVAQTRSEIESLYPEVSDRARFAVGCLRDLT